LRGRFGHAKVDNARRRFPVDLTHQNVGRLQIAVQDGFLVRMLYAIADQHKQLQPLARGQLVLVAIVRDWNAGHVLHDEVRAALWRGAGIEDFGDGRVVHERQRLPLGFEARHHFARVHTRLDQLDGDAAANRLFLLGQPHLAHAALADQLKEVIGTKDYAGAGLTRPDRTGGELCFGFLSAFWAVRAWIVLIACSGFLTRHVGSAS
jgi:hypothetical protein